MKKIIDIVDQDGVLLRKKVVTINDEPSKTQQQFAEAADINNIMKKHFPKGMHQIPDAQKVYADFSSIPDFQGMQDQLIRLESTFMSLDPKIRQRFQNTPQLLVDFLNDPENKDEAVKLGLMKKPEPTPEPAPAPKNPPEPPPGS